MRPISELLSTETVEINKNIFKSSTETVDSRSVEKVDKFLDSNQDVIEPAWRSRHAKFVYDKGYSAYLSLADKARKYGRNPRALMATLINKELSSF